MRWLGALAAVLLVLLLPATLLAHGTEVSVVGEVRPNGPIQIQGEEFEPNDHVRLELRKGGVEPIELGTAAVEADGSFSITLHLAATVSPGIYQLAADGKESAATEVTVMEPAVGEAAASIERLETEEVSSDRPTGETVVLAVLTIAVGTLGGGLVWLSRTRHTRRHGLGGSPDQGRTG